MGLDPVEIVLRTEELFVITVEDGEAAAVHTVGDFYNLNLSEAGCDAASIPSRLRGASTITHKQKKFLFLSTHTPLPARPDVLPWSPQSVCDVLVAVFADQQGLKREEILYRARIAQDLGVD